MGNTGTSLKGFKERTACLDARALTCCFLLILSVLASQSPAEGLENARARDVKGLEEVLASTKISRAVEKHLVQFTCDTNGSLETNLWIAMRRNVTTLQYDTRPISLGQRTLTTDKRFSVIHSNWRQPLTNSLGSILTLDPVRTSDNDSFFLCQAGSRFHGGAHLHVLVPPQIIADKTSPSLVQANEYESLVLRCAVTSDPPSALIWRRENASARLDHVEVSNEQADTLSLGKLTFRSLRRDQAGAYLCLASNGVAPGVSQRFTVQAVRCRSDNLLGPIEDCEPASTPSSAPVHSSVASTRWPQPARRRHDGAQLKKQQRIDAGRVVSIKADSSSAGRPAGGQLIWATSVALLLSWTRGLTARRGVTTAGIITSQANFNLHYGVSLSAIVICDR